MSRLLNLEPMCIFDLEPADRFALPEPPPQTGIPLLDSFRRHFHVAPAETDGLLRFAHRLRYQVYCIECAFEDAVGRADALEVDAFDARQHYVRFLIDGDDCTIEAISREGGLIDRFDAAEVRRDRR